MSRTTSHQFPLLSVLLALANLTACSHSGTKGTVDEAAYHLAGDQSPSQHFATAGLCESKAQSLQKSDPAQALGYYLQAAKATLTGAVAGDPESRALYNRSVANATHLAFIVGKRSEEKLTVPGPDGDWKLEIEIPQYGSHPLHRIDSLETADSVKLTNKKKGIRTSITREGIGGTLVAYQHSNPHRLKEHPFRLHIGTSLPATAVADFPGQNRAKIRIYDTMLSDDVTLSGRKLPLAANSTAALTKLMNHAPKKNIGFKAMEHPEKYLKDTGFSMIEPYRPGKIPVILIHGLKDEPATWRNTYNELIADPTIRKNYQFWFFQYPTGFPLTYISSLFRQHLKDIYKWASEHGGGPELDQTVIVGHSMGSVLSSIEIRDSGTILEQELLTEKISELDVDEETKDALRKLVFIEPPHFISRAILISCPHRGSKYAKGIVGALGNFLIDLPKKVTTLSFLDPKASLKADYLTETGHSVILSPADGIRSLRPYNPALMEIVKLPVGNHITYHSILGNQGKDSIPIEETSDSVVDYWSSHLEGAASEKIVPSKHPAHDHPEGIAEIHRILLLHLTKVGRL